MGWRFQLRRSYKVARYAAVRRSISSRPGTTDFGSNNIISISKHSILLIINHQLIFRICLRAFRARQRPSVLCVRFQPSQPLWLLQLLLPLSLSPSLSLSLNSSLCPSCAVSTPHDLGSPDAWNASKISILPIKRIDAAAQYSAVTRSLCPRRVSFPSKK